MQLRRLSLTWALSGVALLAGALLPATTAFAEGGGDKSGAVPHWSSSFTDPTNHVTYPFTIVGSDPRLGRSTNVDTAIVPLKFKFIKGDQDVSVLNIPARGYVAAAQAATLNGRDDVADTIASPIFTPSNFYVSGDAGVQYGDAVMRAEFGKVGTGYHVTLEHPKVTHTISITVPEDKGVAILNPVGVLMGLVDANWFKARLARVINAVHLAPSTLPIFLSQNVFLYHDGNLLHCCTLGGHGAGSPASTAGVSLGKEDGKAPKTFVYAAYITPSTFPKFPAPFAGFSDIHALSHEIGEWMNDPFGINSVQPWVNPTAAPGTCLSILETGDPVSGVWFPMPGNPNPNPAAGGVWHPEDQVFLNWFARDGEAPGLAPAAGTYTYMGSHTTGIGGPFAAFDQAAQAC
jgi:hypothetical protein